LADCLLEDTNLEILKRRLDFIDSSRIPKFPIIPWDTPTIDAVDKVATVVGHLLKIVMALYLGSHGRLAGSVSLATRRTKSYEALIERWYDVVQWLSYLVQNAAASSRFSKVVQNCSFFLLTVTIDVTHDPLTEELVCQKYFADLTFLMLYQEDPDTETYYNMPNNGGPDGDDSILRFVLRCFDAPASRDYLTSHFRCLSKEVKDEIARSLMVRTQEYIAYVKTAYLAKAVRDLQAIIVIFRWLIEDGGLRINSRDHEPGYIKRLTTAICVWTEKAEAAKITDTGLWTTACEYLALLSRTVSLPVCAGGVRQLMEGGLLPCTARCILHVQSPLTDNYLRTAAPYLYRLYTYLEARQLGDKRWWDWVCSRSALDKPPQSAHLAWHNAFRYAIRGSRGKEDAPIDICSNMTVCCLGFA
jgi:hypothetical protein